MSKRSRRLFLAEVTALSVAGAAARPIAAAPTDRDREPRGPIRLAANENPFGASPRARAAAEHALAEGHRYPASRAADELRAEIARRHGVAEASVLLGAGSHEVLRLAAGAFAGSTQKKIVAPELTFEALLRYAAPFAPAVVRVPPGPDFVVEPEALAKAAGEAGALVYLANPNSPTGLALEGGAVEALARALPAGSTLLLDEAYIDFADDPKIESGVALLGKGLPVVVTRTFSKLHGLAGLRIGYAIGAPEALRTMDAFRTSLGVSAPALAAARAALTDAAFIARSLELVGRGRQQIRTGLEAMGLRSLPSHGNFVYFDWGKPAEPLVTALWDKEIEVPLPFAPAANWVRVTVGTESENAAFLAAVARAK